MWNFSIIGYVLTNAIQNESPWYFIFPNIKNFRQIVCKYTLNPNEDKIHLENNNSAKICLDDTPETNNQWDTHQNYHSLEMGQLISKSE